MLSRDRVACELKTDPTSLLAQFPRGCLGLWKEQSLTELAAEE